MNLSPSLSSSSSSFLNPPHPTPQSPVPWLGASPSTALLLASTSLSAARSIPLRPRCSVSGRCCSTKMAVVVVVVVAGSADADAIALVVVVVAAVVVAVVVVLIEIAVRLAGPAETATDR